MRYPAMHSVDTLYSCVESGTIQRHLADQPSFYRFFTAVTRVEKGVGERAQDEFWHDILQRIRDHRFALCAAPLPVNYAVSPLLAFIQRSLKRCVGLYPALVPFLQELADALCALSTTSDNPLLEVVTSLIADYPDARVALLLRDTRSRSRVADIMAQLSSGKFEIVDQHQMRGITCYDHLLIVGPGRWYPEYILRAPRAKHVHLIYYDWMFDRWQPQPFFTGFSGWNQQYASNGKETETPAPQSRRTVETTDILPEIEWDRLSTTILRQVPSDSEQEEVPSRICLLAGEQAVFLDLSEQAKVLVIDTLWGDSEDEEDEAKQVKRESVATLQPGLFLLLRTSGGGDYLVPVADRILAGHAKRVRSMQEEWKVRLREYAVSRGLSKTSIKLREYGSQRANETNVRNWMASKNIRPQDYGDFLSIMRLVGLQDKAGQYWEAAHMIDTSHRQAGFHIRKLLLAQVARSDLGELHRFGQMDFEIAGTGGGSFTAFRIEQLSPEIVTVPLSRVGHVYSTRRL